MTHNETGFPAENAGFDLPRRLKGPRSILQTAGWYALIMGLVGLPMAAVTNPIGMLAGACLLAVAALFLGAVSGMGKGAKWSWWAAVGSFGFLILLALGGLLAGQQFYLKHPYMKMEPGHWAMFGLCIAFNLVFLAMFVRAFLSLLSERRRYFGGDTS